MEQNTDAASYYGYLFEDDKTPTKVFDALLRGIANYIIEFIGDKETRCLSPPKLAAFYKAVGGNYDALFADVPNPSISYIYQSIGCQHSLQPTASGFVPPSIPALTTRGFVRWESIETLLGPEEHVPFLQAALRNFNIKHPDTGEPFPVDLPKEAFPLHPDPEIERWHRECAEKLRQQATPEEDHSSTGPTVPPKSKIRPGYYTHVRPPSPPGREPRERQEGADYFSSRRPARHVPGRAPLRTRTSRESGYQMHLSPDDVTKPDNSSPSSCERRNSVPDNYYSTSPVEMPPGPNTPQPDIRRRPLDRTRRHSHPRHKREPSSSSYSSESSTVNPKPRTRRARVYSKEASPKLRFTGASPTSPIAGHSPTSSRRFRDAGESYSHDRSGTFQIPTDPSGKLPSPFMQSPRHTPPLRSDSHASLDADNGLRGRERDIALRRNERPRLVKVRSGSHDGQYRIRDTDRDRDWDRRERDRDRDRNHARDWAERSDRGGMNSWDYERRRLRRRTPSPTKGGWRRFVPGLN